MKRLVRLILVASLGLIFSLGVPMLFPTAAQQPVLTQQSAEELIQSGKQHYDAGEFAAAVEKLQQAAKIYQATGDVSLQVQALSFTALAQQKLGHWQEAEAAIAESWSLLRNKQIPNQLRAQVFNAQGQVQLGKGNAEAALESWQDAERFYTQSGDTVGVIGSQINQAQALQVLGFYRRAEKLLVAVEKQLSMQSDSVVTITLQNLGNVRRQARALKRSDEILQLSVAVAQRVKLPQAESQALLSLGNTELALARKAQEIQDKQNAEIYLQKALTNYQKAAAITTSPITKIQAQLNQLSLLLEIQEYTSAQDLLAPISAQLSQLPPSRASVYAHVNFAQSLIKVGTRADPDAKTQGWEDKGDKADLGELGMSNSLDIAKILNRAIAQARGLQDKRAESYALGTLGELYEITADFSEAKKYTQSALVISQAINASDIAYQWQWQMGKILIKQTQGQLSSQDMNADAVKYYTQAFNTLNELRSDLVALNPDVQFSFRDRVEPVYRELVDLLLGEEQPSKKNLIQAREVMEALQLAELDNFFRDACAQPKEVNIDNLDANAAVIYPIILENRLKVILKLPGADNLRYEYQNISATQIDEAAKQLRQFFTRRSASLSELKQASQKIYDWLIKPFEKDLESQAKSQKSQIKTLVFVLDGSLRNLPMSALYDGKQYLIEKYAVAITPGLQLLESNPLQRQAISALIAGASNAPSFEKEGLGAIDNVEIELTGIAQQVNKSQTLLQEKFLQDNVQQQIQSTPFNIVHFATHGKFSSNPEQTYILDWDKRIQVKDLDNLLRSYQVRTAKPVELLILSACETATGDKHAALGLAGVAIRAGARSTLASLWQINDASTAKFMIKFYQQLNNPQISKAEALRNVQLSFLKDYQDTDYHRPYHWAPFILVGNWL
jgi:CHAT domain-containing protein